MIISDHPRWVEKLSNQWRHSHLHKFSLVCQFQLKRLLVNGQWKKEQMIISDIRFLPFLLQNICKTCRNAKLILKTFLTSLCWAKACLYLPWMYKQISVLAKEDAYCINVFLSIYLNNFVCICTVLFLKLFHLRRSLFLITAVHRV